MSLDEESVITLCLNRSLFDNICLLFLYILCHSENKENPILGNLLKIMLKTKFISIKYIKHFTGSKLYFFKV